MNTYETIKRRRSIRKYRPESLKQEEIDLIVHSAMQAPSARCQMPWHFIIVTDKEKLQALAKISPNYRFIASAPCVICFMFDDAKLSTPGFVAQDMGASVMASLLTACSLKIGSCWCGTYPNEERMNSVRTVLNIPVEYTPFAVVSYGYVEDEEELRFIDRYDSSRIHYEGF